jgi:hypothetical protein
VRAGFARLRQREHDIGGLAERRFRIGGDRDQPDAEAARIVDQAFQLGGLARPGQRHDGVVAGDHAEVAMAGLGRMHEEGRRAGGGERGRDLVRHMPGLAHAADDQPAADAADQLDRFHERRAELVSERGRQRGDAAAFRFQRAHRRCDQGMGMFMRFAAVTERFRFRHGIPGWDSCAKLPRKPRRGDSRLSTSH